MPKSTNQHIQPYVYASVFSSVLIILGILWDVSWHLTIGRDSFFSPPHIAVYAGAVFSGIYSGYMMLRTSFFGTPDEKQASIKFWWIFHGSLGELFSIWGGLAMLTAAPLDNWWHNTYGRDLILLSPPHALLFTGMIVIQFGAMLTVLSSSHRATGHTKLQYKRLFILAAGLILATFCTLFSELLSKARSHSALYYQVASIIFPLLLIAVKRATGLRWAATATAAVYMSVLVLMQWVLPLFPATPRLGPVLTHITHFQPYNFPMLLILPALVVDVLFNRAKQTFFTTTIFASLLFLLLFWLLQWNFGAFLLTSVQARGWFFGSYSWYFSADPDFKYRYAFFPGQVDTGFALIKGMSIAGVLAITFGMIGYKWGEWIKEVKR